MDTAAFIRQMATPLSGELHAAQKVAVGHFRGFQSKGLSGSNSTSFEDCLLLYVLVRHFRRTHVFETGTNVATTAVVMNEAARRNGGKCTTCDPVNYGAVPPWSGIRFMNMGSSLALQALFEESQPIDFLFFDWMPDARSLELLPKICVDPTITAVHDYGAGDMKGEEAVVRLNASPFFQRPGRWHLPDAQPVDIGNGVRINACTAFFVPAGTPGSEC
jgi:hypothetical protein